MYVADQQFPQYGFGHIKGTAHSLIAERLRNMVRVHCIGALFDGKKSTIERQQRGRVSETLVAIRYKLMGYRVLHRNWRIPGGELDLVLRRGSQVVVVEVRARCFRGLLHPMDTITTAKKNSPPQPTTLLSPNRVLSRLGVSTWLRSGGGYFPWIEVQADVQFERD